MDQYIDNRQKEIFWTLLANPADNGASYLQSLERLAKDHPQSGLLHAMVARAAGGGSRVKKAAAFVKPRILHKLVNDAAGLPLVESSAIIDMVAGLENSHATVPAQQTISQLSDTPVVTNTAVMQDTIPPSEIAETITDDHENNWQDSRPLPVDNEAAEAENTATIINEPAIQQPGDVVITDNSETAVGEAEEVSPATLKGEEESEAGQADGLVMEPQQAQPVDAAFPETEQTATVPQTDAKPEDNNYHFASRFPKHEVPPVQEEEKSTTEQPIEDEIYDEIVSIDDIGFAAKAENDLNPEIITEHRFSEPETSAAHDADAEQPSALFHQPDAQPETEAEIGKIQEEEEKLILGGIVGGDYLSFDKKLDELRSGSGHTGIEDKDFGTAESMLENGEAVSLQADTPVKQPDAESEQDEKAADENRVSRYDDDKMPYTFLWWLNKTRKEYAENLRPYAPVAQKQAGYAKEAGVDNLKRADELQQQYFENIFSLTSVSGIEREEHTERVEFDPNKKEDVIIERFIQTDPQIKPLSADKLDNENKAKKSSEDQNEVVTETLARIYADQMLYHKAIATYKKLILKFPEKSTYFAARIEELEKKTN